MKKILITGGCGFIGLNLIKGLETKGVSEIIILDNLSNSQEEYLREFEVRFYQGDIRDDKLVPQLMQGVDGVVHLAADTRVLDSIANPDFNFSVNVEGTYNLLRAARDAHVGHFVFASTGGAIVGDVTPPVHEDIPPRPISPYGASKLAGEAYCSAFAGSYGMKTVSLRFSNVYGPRSYHKGSVVAHFFKQLLKGESLTVYGDGTQTRDFVYVEDLSEAIYRALKLPHGGVSYQLGTGIETSLNTLLDLIRQTVDQDHDIQVRYEDFRPGEVRRNFARIDKARQELGYAPQTDFLEGLQKTWQWFLRYSRK